MPWAHRYREEGRALQPLGRFLNTRPVAGRSADHDGHCARQRCSQGHRIGVDTSASVDTHPRVLPLSAPRRRPYRRAGTAVFCRLHVSSLWRASSAETKGKIFLQACAKLAIGRASRARCGAGTALRRFVSGRTAGWGTTAPHTGRCRSRWGPAQYPAYEVRQVQSDPAQSLGQVAEPGVGNAALWFLPASASVLFSLRGRQYSIAAPRVAFRQTLKTAGIEEVGLPRGIKPGQRFCLWPWAVPPLKSVCVPKWCTVNVLII